MEGKDIASSLMPNPLDLREVFYSNLMLLGFDSEAAEASYRIPLNRDMFAFPNKKAMEIVCHFLFCRLNPQQAFQEFRDCWPIQDKKMEQQFRKSCNSWLTKIYKEEQDSNLPRIGPSLFLSPGGDRFYELMFHFSSFVLRRVMVREHGKHGTIPHLCKKTARNPNMTRISSKAMTVQTISEKKRFFEEVQYALEVQENWKSYAMTSTKEHRKLSREKRELERRLNSKGHGSFSKDRTTLGDEADALRRTTKLQEVRELWLKLESFYNSTEEKRTVLNGILDGNKESFSIDGSEIHLQIPEALMTEYKHYIQMKNISNTYEAGKLNLLSLIQLCNIALHQLKEKIRQDGIQSFEEFAPFIKNELRGHVAHLNSAQNLRSALINDVIPEIKKSIDKLKDECYATLDQGIHSPIASLESFDFGLGLMPTTPSPAFAATDKPFSNAGVIPENSLRKTPYDTDTPDVVENLTTSVREMVIKDSQQLDETKFDGKHISERSVEGSEAPKPFHSKIPKPISRRLSQTPDGLSGRSTVVVKRKSLSTSKISKKKTRNRIEAAKINSPTAISGMDSPRVGKSVMKSTPGNDFSVNRLENFPAVTQGDSVGDYSTPKRSGFASSLKKNPTSARNILAEKIAQAVFANEPTIRAGNSSSQSSSGENTPKDLGVADPLANLGEEPFQSKDLILRTPSNEDSCPGFMKNDGGGDLENVKTVTDFEPSSPISAGMQSERRPSSREPSFKDDSFSGNTKVISPTITCDRSPLHTSVTPSTPQGIQPIQISWKTPFTPHSGTLNSTYSFTPIESKLTVVDINTPFGVSPARDRTAHSHQLANVAVHPISEFTRSPVVSSSTCGTRTIAESSKVLASWKSSPFHERLVPVPQSPGSPCSDHRKLVSDNFMVSIPGRTTTERDQWLHTPMPNSNETSQLPPLPTDTSLSERKSFFANSVTNEDRIKSSGTPLRGSISSDLLHEELIVPFEVPEGSTPAITSATIQTGIIVSSVASTAAFASPSISTASEKPCVTNDLLLRYERLKKAQEMAQTSEAPNIFEDTSAISQLPMSVLGSKAFASPITTPRRVENVDREILASKTPLLENITPIDFNGNSVSFEEREDVKSRLFLDRSPLLPSVMDPASRQFSIDSPLVQKMESRMETLAVQNLGADELNPVSTDSILEGQGLHLISVEAGHLLDDQLISNRRGASREKIPEDKTKTRRLSFGNGNGQHRHQTQQDFAISRPLETVQSVEVGQLIDFD